MMRPLLHFCPLSRQCREYDAPWRVSGWIGNLFWSLALRPRDRHATTLDGPVRWFSTSKVSR
jgi:hypothetical protein